MSSPFNPHPWKHNFEQSHDQKDHAEKGIEAKEGLLNPVQATPPRQPMFQQQTTQNENQPYVIDKSKSTSQNPPATASNNGSAALYCMTRRPWPGGQKSKLPRTASHALTGARA